MRLGFRVEDLGCLAVDLGGRGCGGLQLHKTPVQAAVLL